MQKVRIELVLCCPVAIRWNYPKTDTFLLSNSASTANATMCTTLMLKLFPFYHQCLAFAHEIRIICSIYYGASYSNWTGFSVFTSANFLRKFFQRKWKNMRYCSRRGCRCCCCPLAFYKNIMFYHPSRILVYGMALCRLWFATCYFYLAIFVYMFLHLQICNCNCPVYVFVELEMQHHGSRQQCHHSKLTKSQQSHSLSLSASFCA